MIPVQSIPEEMRARYPAEKPAPKSFMAECPCCGNTFDSLDQPDEYKRIVEWSAARELGRRNAGVKKHLTPEQRQAKAVILARNRSKRQNKTTP